MSTAIAVTSSELALPAVDPHTPAAHVLTPPDRQSLDDALSQIRVILDQHGYLVVLHTSAASRASVQRLYAIRSVLESDRIALVESELPPLALAVLVRQLRQLSTADLNPGVLAGAIRLLSYYIHAGAVLNSVSKLDNVPVPVSSHARSWLPGSQFAVLASPTPQLIKIGSGPEVLKGPDYTTCMTTAAGHFGSDWVSDTLAERWRVAALEPAPLPQESARWWGSGKLIEFAAAIPDISMLYQLVCSVQRALCHWCGLELIGDRCVFCRAPVTGAAAARQRPQDRTSGPADRTPPPAERVPVTDPRVPAPPLPHAEPGAQPGVHPGAQPGRTDRPALNPSPPTVPPHAASRLTQARTTRPLQGARPPESPGRDERAERDGMCCCRIFSGGRLRSAGPSLCGRSPRGVAALGTAPAPNEVTAPDELTPAPRRHPHAAVDTRCSRRLRRGADRRQRRGVQGRPRGHRVRTRR
ncbi:hypothetical protein [Streptomyces tardus]|uniref:hypothetical protein n=1 Tax=Streptomyces tardus TaxID=2780544 RepID=UPI0027E4B144|nr:hypothetical protein [Streptomyces tardus]